MKTREELLSELRAGFESGILTEADMQPFLRANIAHQTAPKHMNNTKAHENLSAVDVMFYIAGFVLFASILSSIVQSWDEDALLTQTLLSGGIGFALWLIAYYLIKNPLQNEIRKGLTNSLLLTGSLLVITFGYIATNEVIGGFSEVNLIPAALTLVLLGALHILFDKLIKRDMVLLLGILLTVSSFPALLFGLLAKTDTAVDVWVLIMIITAGLLVYATRVVAMMYKNRDEIHNAFDSFSAFLALSSMYIASFGGYGVLWLGVLVASVFGIFYLSIVMQNKQLLGSGSFFMVLTIITVSFKYFSGYGATLSLIVASIGLLASAAVASNINKKYFGQKIANTSL